jgi:hypothetical protein
MLQTLRILAKHPSQTGERARIALWMLDEERKRTGPAAQMLGVAEEDDGIGWGIDDAFNLALKPVTVPLKYLWKGTKAAARGLGITHADNSPEQVRLARMKAAQERRRAAQARARAADAQSEAEYRAQQALADAADTEADAADAEAVSREAAMQTAEAQYLPGQTDLETAANDDQQGAPMTIGSVFSQLALAKARQLARQDAQFGIRRSAVARAILAKDFARKALRARGIAA